MENVRNRCELKILTSLELFLKQKNFETRIILDVETTLPARKK